MLQSINPATGEIIKTFEELTDEQINQSIEKAQTAFLEWRRVSYADRAVMMKKLGNLFRSKSRELGEIVTKEMGKPINQAVAEVEKCGWVCDYYADHAEEILSKEIIETDAQESYVRFDPIGIVLAVMPWNYPFWQAMRFIAPALMAGNVGLLKHASNVQLSGIEIEDLILEAGFPEGVFQNLCIGSHKVKQVINYPHVKAATLTGSEYAGSQVAMQCGEKIKPTVLELGGSDPFIVLDDADISFTCEIGGKARLQNAGQSCIAAKRFIVMKSVFSEFMEKFKAQFEAQVIGHPMDEKTTIGAMVSEAGVKDIENLVNKSVEMGAKLVMGGNRWGNKGAFYEPTILTNISKGMPAYAEEFFGPVALVFKVSSEQEAINLANDTPFGLGDSIWTTNLDRARKMIPFIDSGAVFINSMVKSDPRLPFGGVKTSGYGRELSHYGIKEFVNIKTVYFK